MIAVVVALLVVVVVVAWVIDAVSAARARDDAAERARMRRAVDRYPRDWDDVP